MYRWWNVAAIEARVDCRIIQIGGKNSCKRVRYFVFCATSAFHRAFHVCISMRAVPSLSNVL